MDFNQFPQASNQQQKQKRKSIPLLGAIKASARSDGSPNFASIPALSNRSCGPPVADARPHLTQHFAQLLGTFCGLKPPPAPWTDRTDPSPWTEIATFMYSRTLRGPSCVERNGARAARSLTLSLLVLFFPWSFFFFWVGLRNTLEDLGAVFFLS